MSGGNCCALLTDKDLNERLERSDSAAKERRNKLLRSCALRPAESTGESKHGSALWCVGYDYQSLGSVDSQRLREDTEVGKCHAIRVGRLGWMACYATIL